MYSECFKCSCWFTALASLQTCLQPQRNTAACEGSFKSTTVEKNQKFCSQRPGNWLPLLRPSNHSDLLATSLMSFYNCVHAIQCMRAVTLQPLKCAPFFGSCVLLRGESPSVKSRPGEAVWDILLSFTLAGRKRLGTPASLAPFTMLIVLMWERV